MPTDENFLLSIARYGSAAHVERLVAMYRGSPTADVLEAERDAAARAADRRTLTHHVDEDGMLVLRARLPPEEGALLVKALDTVVEHLDADRPLDPADPHPDVSAETPPGELPPTPRDRADARRADALSSIARESLARGTTTERRSSSDRHHVTVVVDAATLAGDNDVGHGGDAAECHVPHGPSLAPDTVRRLCCDGAVSGPLERNGRTLSIGRRSRAIPPSMHRALLRRDGGCRFPGCTAHRFVDGHRIRHWANGGETSLDNLVCVCSHHHKLLHEGGFSVERVASGRADSEFLFRAPIGRAIRDRVEPVSAETPLPIVEPSQWGWDGSSMDWSSALEELQLGRLRGDVDRAAA